MIQALAFALLLSRTQEHGEYLAGYMIIPPAERIERTYNAGFSMYVAVWPLLNAYPGHRFQTGLPGTWMFAQYDGAAPKDMYSDVEGGLGWWTDTRFPTETPKFIMGGVGPNFSEIANGPAHGAGDWNDPRGLYGVAQLSPWLLFPIDGLNLKQGTCGDLLGYGYLNLPLCDAKPSSGNNCWTLFLNSQNFKGPVAFFTPHFWSHNGLKDARLQGQLLDSRPSEPNTALQMETQYIPCQIAKDAKGQSYARIATTSFPRNQKDESVLLHQPTSYDKRAIWDGVNAWFGGGQASSGSVNLAGARSRTFRENGYMTWDIRTPLADGAEKKIPIAWQAFATPAALDSNTFGCRWDFSLASKNGATVTFPEYFRLENSVDAKKAKWVPVRPDQVPGETGLAKLAWTRPIEPKQDPYSTPDDSASCWKKPGPAAGPFRAHLGDESVVTYYWYRFADQPALLNAGLTDDEREQLQSRVLRLHRAWTKDRNYLAPPKVGRLANLDPAQIVKPPKGLEVGYVPIATRQAMER